MQHLTDLLEGYCDPVTKKHAVSAIGQTGLTSRLFVLCYYDAAIQSLIRLHTWQFGREHCYETYWPVLQMCRASWVTEFMRLMDKPRTLGKENLTIRLYHERFQKDATVPANALLDEQSRFDALDHEYRTHKLWEFRCEKWFHLDLSSTMQQPTDDGADLHHLTTLARDWYAVAAGYVIGAEPKYVTVGGAQRGREFAREFRRLMLSRVRQRKANCPPELWTT
jgi:hypothetical protein